LKSRLVSKELDEHINSIRKPIGTLGYDPWGYNNETIKYGLSIAKPIYEKYFRTEAHGVDHIPAEGPVLIVGNHSGQLPIDGILVGYALASRQKNPRIPRAMIERFFPTVPWLGNFLNEVGAVLGDPVNCARMLANNEAIIVFPEGVRGSGKLYRDRYKLQRFGPGFMHLAMEYNATIVPVGVVGCEETIPALANIKPLARLLGLPYFPLAAPVVLPAKVHICVGEPMEFDNDNIPEEQVTARVELVKAAVGEMITKGLNQRKRIF
jgi:1-acyl-sn-glycerol-3-phosphate acyltransferase